MTLALGGSGSPMTEQIARSQTVHRGYTRPVLFVPDVNRLRLRIAVLSGLGVLAVGSRQ